MCYANRNFYTDTLNEKTNEKPMWKCEIRRSILLANDLSQISDY